MKNFICCTFLAICLVLSPTSRTTADVGQAVNAFYGNLVETLKQPQFMKKVAEMVLKDRDNAETCLTKLKRNIDAPGDKGKAYRIVHDYLEEAMYLTTKDRVCNDKITDRLIARLASYPAEMTADDRPFVLENILRLCPAKADLVQMLGPPQSMRNVGEIVQKNPRTVKRCISALKEKVDLPGEVGKWYRSLYERLEEALYLTMRGPSCNQRLIDRLTTRVGSRPSDQRKLTADDKIFVLENILRLCPAKESTLQTRLADCYFFECQFGMAVAAYKKALKAKDDEDGQEKLKLAAKCEAEYLNGKPLNKKDFQKLITEMRGMSLAGTRVKLQHKTAIQTNRILFDEWSYYIRREAWPELKEVGEGVKYGFREEPRKLLLIEGHTDKRGAREKLKVLSEQRAEAVKSALTKEFGIDPSRLRTKGSGPDKPFSPREDDEGYALNRRVEFRVIDDSEIE